MPEKINLALFGVLQVQAHAEALIQGHGEQAFARHQALMKMIIQKNLAIPEGKFAQVPAEEATACGFEQVIRHTKITTL